MGWYYSTLSDQSLMRYADLVAAPIQWREKDQQTNATATATKAAQAGFKHMVLGISVSASAQPASNTLVELKNGATVLDQWEIPAFAFAPIVLDFSRPYECDVNAAAVLTVGAMGAGVRCSIQLKGRTVAP